MGMISCSSKRFQGPDVSAVVCGLGKTAEHTAFASQLHIFTNKR